MLTTVEKDVAHTRLQAAVESPRVETRTEARRRAAAVPQSREPLPATS